MATNNTNKKINLFIGALVFLIIAISGYITISDLAGKQSQQHQQSISPVFALVEDELLVPLYTAKTLSDVGTFDEFVRAEQPDKEKLFALLKHLETTFGHTFYLAHDKSMQQYTSSGRSFDLEEGKVVWYFALKPQDEFEVQAVLGKRENVHLYIDIRQYDNDGTFVGFAGLGKSLDAFLASFEQFRSEYGHEFIFVNNQSQIVLSSIPDLSPRQADTVDDVIGIKNIDEVHWYSDFTEQAGDDDEPSVIVQGERGDLLVSRLTLENLNWSIYILTPLDLRQQEVNKSFALYVAVSVILLIFVYKIIMNIVDRYVDRVHRHINQDPLTLLANREYGRAYFNRMRRRHRQMAVIVCDLDRFKEINDENGHVAGDSVLKTVAETFNFHIDKKGEVIRWGGEEFVIILPDTDLQEAKDLAEQCRLGIERLKLDHNGKAIKVTGSFGLCASRQYADNLEVMVERADRAMYQAKMAGRNTVIEQTTTL